MKPKKNEVADENSEEILVRCSMCGILYHLEDLIDDVCPDCGELTEAEMDLEDEEMT